MVVVKDGWAVQSFGYNRYLPLGKPECLVENLDRWGADEIMVLSIDRSISDRGPDLALLERLAQLGLETPLIYGGGIRSVKDGVQVIQMGADRLCVDALIHNDIETIRGLSQQLGVQAVIGVLPISWSNEHIKWFDYRTKVTNLLSDQILTDLAEVVSELLVVDWLNEGKFGAFDPHLVTHFPDKEIPLIAFGGLSQSEQIIELLSMPNISAIAVGNFLSYKEHAIQLIKEEIIGSSLRPPNYESRYTLMSDV